MPTTTARRAPSPPAAPPPTTPRLDPKRAAALADQLWERDALPAITEYIRIPNQSPHFDKNWVAAGHMARATDLIENWCKARAARLRGLRVERLQLPNRTPLLYLELPGHGEETVLLYGHLDKQPEMSGWRAGLGAWTPVRDGDRLYGRGGADDGYAAFAALNALELLADQGVPHARCVAVIEACEESGSYDLPFYIDELTRQGRLGTPSLVVCLDSGCGDYERLWSTTSLRGLVGGELTVSILREGVHSGDASGIVPSSFRIARQVLARLEDVASGKIVPRWLHARIPAQRAAQAKATARVLGKDVYAKFPFVDGAGPMGRNVPELILNRTWRPTLSVIGIEDGLPPAVDPQSGRRPAPGNVLRPQTTLHLSVRLPPTVEADDVVPRLKKLLEADPPYGAKVELNIAKGSTGWEAPALAPWLGTAIDAASKTYFGQGAAHMGEGGTIPFMKMLGDKFPQAQFLVTGVLGPESNAHGPNEFLHVPTAKRLTCCVAAVVAAHHARRREQPRPPAPRGRPKKR
jgi:acetylornithine deacetylase/succinyl-diaminopimelate desuccinylase-like protein